MFSKTFGDIGTDVLNIINELLNIGKVLLTLSKMQILQLKCRYYFKLEISYLSLVIDYLLEVT